MASSIKENGLIDPLIVRKKENGRYELNNLYDNNGALTREYYKNAGLEQILNDINMAAFANKEDKKYLSFINLF